MKISALEKWVLVLTAVILLLTVGFFVGQRLKSEAYVISEHTLETGRADEPSGSSSVHKKININTATVAQLQSLPGIGQTRAEAIVADRRANGPFRDPKDITRIPGIGAGTLAEILDYITVN